MESSLQFTRPKVHSTAHPYGSGGPSMNQLARPHNSSRIERSQYPTTTLELQALRTSHSMRAHGPPPYIGAVNQGLFPGNAFMTAPQRPTSMTLGLAPIQKQYGSHTAHFAHMAYPYLPPPSPHFDPLSPSPNLRQGQPTMNIANAEYSDTHLDWLLSLAEASHHRYPSSTNPTIMVSPAGGNYSPFASPKAGPEATFFAASVAADTCVTGSHPDIGPVLVPGTSGSLGASLTPVFSSTPSTFDFSTSPGLTLHSPAVPRTIRPLTEESEAEQGPDLVSLFSHPPSVPCGNFAVEHPYSKETPSAPSGGNLLSFPLSTQLAFPGHNRPSEFEIHNAVQPPSGQVPYATGRTEVRFPNQKKVNVVADMCKRFPEESHIGILLKRICATGWYHIGGLEPIFGPGSQELTVGLALGFEVGQSVLLGFTGSDGQCLYCGHRSTKKDRIIAHVREHLGLRPFVCMDEKCPCKELHVRPSFSSREALTGHLRSTIRIVTCNFCLKSIKSNNFRRHLNARHRDQLQLPERQRAKPRSKSLPA